MTAAEPQLSPGQRVGGGPTGGPPTAPCTSDRCQCWEWEEDVVDGTPRHGGKDGEPQCIGPMRFADDFLTFGYDRLCGCPAMASDVLCWGCYLDSK